MTQTVTINDAARIKGVSRQAVHAAIKAEKLDIVIVEVPSKRITRKSLNQWQPNLNMKRAGRPRKQSK